MVLLVQKSREAGGVVPSGAKRCGPLSIVQLNFSLRIPWVFGVFIGLYTGLAIGLYFGGGVYLRHYLLRFLLWRSGALPWHVVRLYEEATECILLSRVGGGYRFIHPLLQQHFASQVTSPLTP